MLFAFAFVTATAVVTPDFGVVLPMQVPTADVTKAGEEAVAPLRRSTQCTVRVEYCRKYPNLPVVFDDEPGQLSIDTCLMRPAQFNVACENPPGVRASAIASHPGGRVEKMNVAGDACLITIFDICPNAPTLSRQRGFHDWGGYASADADQNMDFCFARAVDYFNACGMRPNIDATMAEWYSIGRFARSYIYRGTP